MLRGSIPLPRKLVTKSWFRVSATTPRTVRVMIPIGITLSVTAGRMRWRRCSQSQAQALSPPGPAPIAGSAPRLTLKMITSTMPSQ